MKIRVIVPLGDKVTVEAIDLVGDCWADYLYHLEQAARAERSQELHEKNRSLRAGLLSLSAHFEGIIEKVCSNLKTSQVGFPPPSKGSLESRVRVLEQAAQSLTATSLPPLTMKFKRFRDILAHPGITKHDPKIGTPESVERFDVDLYDLTADDLRDLGTAVACWLDALCNAYSVVRFEDTEAAARSFGEVLGVMQEPPRRM